MPSFSATRIEALVPGLDHARDVRQMRAARKRTRLRRRRLRSPGPGPSEPGRSASRPRMPAILRGYGDRSGPTRALALFVLGRPHAVAAELPMAEDQGHRAPGVLARERASRRRSTHDLAVGTDAGVGVEIALAERPQEQAASFQDDAQRASPTVEVRARLTVVSAGALSPADDPPHEAGRLQSLLRQHLAHGFGLFLGERLKRQHAGIVVEGLELPFDDLVDDVVRLARFLGRFPQALALFLAPGPDRAPRDNRRPA